MSKFHPIFALLLNGLFHDMSESFKGTGDKKATDIFVYISIALAAIVSTGFLIRHYVLRGKNLRRNNAIFFSIVHKLGLSPAEIRAIIWMSRRLHVDNLLLLLVQRSVWQEEMPRFPQYRRKQYQELFKKIFD